MQTLIGACLGLILALGVKPTPIAEPAFAVPEVLKGYQLWRTAAPEPFPVPYELAIQCSLATPEQIAKAAREHGPHNSVMVQVFTNPTASSAFYASTPGRFPEGSIVVKEKSTWGGKSPTALAAMIKRGRGSRPASGDWEFLYISPEGTKLATSACQDCHRTAATDFLFRSYPRGVSR